MNKELNNYIEKYSEFVDVLVEFQCLHVSYTQKPTVRKRADLIRTIKIMRRLVKDLETSVRVKYISKKNRILQSSQEIETNKEETNE